MPEGDTIHRIATKLQPLVGRKLERVTTQGLVRAIGGTTVTSVSPTGKHLVIELDDDSHLRVHLGMNGRVRHYPRAEGEALLARMSPGRASLALVTSDTVHLWINARTVEISPRRAPMHGHAVLSLGPDVLADDFDSRLAGSRAALHPTRTIGEVVLDQRVACGIGNIYKSESLFACGIDPRTRVGDLALDQLAAIYASASEIMRGNLGPAPRNAFAVYSRTGRPCPRCRTAIGCYQLGDPPRWTWSCPQCQAPGGAAGVKR
jgi:endonuclease-8